MTDLQRLEELAETQTKEKLRLAGSIDALLDDLHEEGWETEASAARTMRKLKGQIAKQEKEYNRTLAKFEEEFGGELR